MSSDAHKVCERDSPTLGEDPGSAVARDSLDSDPGRIPWFRGHDRRRLVA